ncbi:uncharacterized protein [Equus asinus]|uniref:uncharacterized protein n=1 Tax=Equus asinus TaxID=9793 RepID=UPI0038F620BC
MQAEVPGKPLCQVRARGPARRLAVPSLEQPGLTRSRRPRHEARPGAAESSRAPRLRRDGSAQSGSERLGVPAGPAQRLGRQQASDPAALSGASPGRYWGQEASGREEGEDRAGDRRGGKQARGGQRSGEGRGPAAGAAEDREGAVFLAKDPWPGRQEPKQKDKNLRPAERRGEGHAAGRGSGGTAILSPQPGNRLARRGPARAASPEWDSRGGSSVGPFCSPHSGLPSGSSLPRFLPRKLEASG